MDLGVLIRYLTVFWHPDAKPSFNRLLFGKASKTIRFGEKNDWCYMSGANIPGVGRCSFLSTNNPGIPRDFRSGISLAHVRLPHISFYENRRLVRRAEASWKLDAWSRLKGK